ncbi:MAG: endopeptidase La [Peptococcaceae bacterium]|jgi:ATP-dependent Lon protease|nr:endopeptidase La [Peptococcaceae bacterium]
MDQNDNRPIQRLPLLPLRGIIVFPGMMMHLDVGREKSVKAMESAMLNQRQIFLLAQRDTEVDDPGADDLYHLGTVAEIKQMLKLPGDTVRVLVEGVVRAALRDILQTEPHMEASFAPLPDQTGKDLSLEAAMRTLTEQFEKYVRLGKKVTPETMIAITSIDEPGRLCDFVASHVNLKLPERQHILETLSIGQRVRLLGEILGRELEILDIERKINAQVRQQLDKNQKEYYLREQVKVIQKELGEKEERQTETEEYRENLEKAGMPEDSLEKAIKEVERLEKMPPMTAEATVVRNYLDWLLMVPWQAETTDNLDLRVAEEILEADHYGLEKPKERILEYLAVRKLTQTIKGPILCLVGPPGVGKTSLAKSVARALNRKFVRMSLGGVRDEAEIRGHRRTYVGAMPGRIIQGLRTAGTKNPVFLLDEVDKMSMDFRGDPSSALLEVLDPEQNFSFSDHYIEMPVDLSKVLFIVTANVAYNIPPPLMDRMELIPISGYTEVEKLEIARRYLVPKQRQENGLKKSQLRVGVPELRQVIESYTREAGIRGLEREVARLCRKAARQIADGSKNSVVIGPKVLREFLGIPRYRHRTALQENLAGMANGLAWTEVGGEVLQIEVSPMKGGGKLILTGKLGDVMKESAQAGYSFIRSRAAELGIGEKFYKDLDIHIHIPEGAIPKDGPSAGITMATALASALSKRQVRGHIAMTGEITLRGRVLPVGGIKEKVLAAHRAGCSVIILPAENEKDLEDIPANVRQSLEFQLVETMDEVLALALMAPGEATAKAEAGAKKGAGGAAKAEAGAKKSAGAKGKAAAAKAEAAAGVKAAARAKAGADAEIKADAGAKKSAPGGESGEK